MSKNSATIRPPEGWISDSARESCQPREESGSWLSSVEHRPANANRIGPSVVVGLWLVMRTLYVDFG
jgi:hypothetical protein